MNKGEGVSITVYGRPGCGDCTTAKKILDSEGVPYKYIDIEEDPSAVEIVNKVSASFGRLPAVPVIVADVQTPEINAQFSAVEPRGLAMIAFARMTKTLITLNKPTS